MDYIELGFSMDWIPYSVLQIKKASPDFHPGIPVTKSWSSKLMPPRGFEPLFWP
jgi:hypothetical protein